jgi:SAM-dependent methyltransferase
VLKIIQRLPPDSLLEIGCGAGALLDELGRGGWHATGVETSPRALAERLTGRTPTDSKMSAFSSSESLRLKVWMLDSAETGIVTSAQPMKSSLTFLTSSFWYETAKKMELQDFSCSIGLRFSSRGITFLERSGAALGFRTSGGARNRSTAHQAGDHK